MVRVNKFLFIGKLNNMKDKKNIDVVITVNQLEEDVYNIDNLDRLILANKRIDKFLKNTLHNEKEINKRSQQRRL